MGFMVNLILLILGIRYSQQNVTPEEIQKFLLSNNFLHKIQVNLQNGMQTKISPQCLLQLAGLDIRMIIDMIDSTGKVPPSGFFEGNMDMGSYDRCLSIKSTDKIENVGKYCIANINIMLEKSVNHIVIRHSDGDPNIMKAAPTTATSSVIQIRNAFCVPNGCSADDLSSVITSDIFNVTFSEEQCQTSTTLSKLDTAAIAFISFCAIILVIVFLSTAYDTYYYYICQDAPYSILTTFSILTNGRKLLRTSKNPDIISCLHGVRALSIIWVIVGHCFIMRITFPLKNAFFLLEWMNDVGNMFILGATVSVDSFFLISGLALTYSYLLYRRKGNKFNLLLFYIHRYLRLTPALAVVIFFHVSLLKYSGSGPMWPFGVTSFETPCKENWWKALLYVQNYGAAEQTCIAPSWYLSVDTQLYILSPIILLPLSIWPRLTLLGTGLLTILSMLSCFLVGWFYELNAQMFGNLDIETITNYTKHYYAATHTRASVWLIGVLYGYLLFTVKNGSRKLSIHKGIILISWIISLTVLCTCVYAGHDLKDQVGDKLNKFENSIYLALVRPSWGIALGWIIFLCFTGHAGPINWFLSLPAFEVIAKLSYSLYLVHMTVMLFTTGQLRTPVVFSNFNMMHAFWGDFGYSIICAVLLYLGIEYPIAILEQQLLGRSKGSVKKEKEIVPHDSNLKKIDDIKEP